MAVSGNVPLSRRYRARAEECRRIARVLFHAGETQLKLLRIAADYDWMAMRAAVFDLQQAERSLPVPEHRKLATILVTIPARLIHLWAKGSPSLPLLPSVDGRAWLGYAPAFNIFPETNTHRS